MKILAVDFGLKNIGLAISFNSLAEPFGQLTVKSIDDAVIKLAKIGLKNKIGLYVVGLPDGRLVPKIRKFGKALQLKTKIPIFFQDETLTSSEALTKMLKIYKSKYQRDKKKHIVAACLILQSYLDNLEFKKKP